MVVALSGDILIVTFYDGKVQDSENRPQDSKIVSKHVAYHMNKLNDVIVSYRDD